MTTKRNVIFNRICTFIFLLCGRARTLDIDRLRSLNSAINDCVHRLRGLRSNEYDERVAALGERAVHTDLRLIDWTPFHSTTPRHRGSTPAPSISPYEWTNIVDNIKRTAGIRERRWRIEINNCGIKPGDISSLFDKSKRKQLFLIIYNPDANSSDILWRSIRNRIRIYYNKDSLSHQSETKILKCCLRR